MSVPSVSVRAFEPSDIPHCLAIFASNIPKFFTEAERGDFVAFLEALPGPYFIVETVSGDAVGCGGYAVDAATGRADMCWGMVRQDMHGMGLGRLLTEARLWPALRDPAVRMVALNTSQHTTGFYERFGFAITEVIKDGYSPGLDRCEMRLAVAAERSDAVNMDSGRVRP